MPWTVLRLEKTGTSLLKTKKSTPRKSRALRTIEIDQFAPRSEIDERFIDSPYYLAANSQAGQDAFAVIRLTWFQ
jgi:non-homologous end joining protein Ku